MRRTPFDFPEREKPTNSAPTATTLAGWSSFEEWNGGSGGLPIVNEKTALTVSAIYASVNLLAGAVSALPVNLYTRKPDGERDLRHSDPLWWTLNEQMTPRWSAAVGWEYLVQSLLLHGDGFAEIRRTSMGEVAGLEPIHPSRVRVVPTPDGGRLVYVVAFDPTLPPGSSRDSRVIDQDDMLHIPGFGFDGLRGLSPLRYALRMAGSVALATQDYSARFFANSARPDYALQTSQQMTPEKIDHLREQIAERNGGSNAHKPMVLTNGLELKTITLPAEDMQLISTRQFQIEEIARIYGIPPFMIGHNEKTTSWGSGVEAMGQAFVRYALRQHLNKFQNELNRKLFRTAARVAEFDTTELERGDTTAMFNAFKVALGGAGAPGFMTVNEVRGRLSLKRIEGADKLSEGGPNAPQPNPQPAGA